MGKKVFFGLLCVCMVPFMQGCDDRDVARGAVAGAVIGGTIGAIASDNYDGNNYYRYRYNNYYRHRHGYYNNHYGSRYYGNRYGHYRGGFRRGHFGHRHFDHVVDAAAVKAPARTAVEKFADFYQMPMDSAQKIWGAQQKALQGDVGGLTTLGLFAADVERLANMQPADKDTLYRMSLRTGLSEAHARDVLVDFQQELKASREAGRVEI